MLPYIAEFLGTMMLIILGDGVVAPWKNYKHCKPLYTHSSDVAPDVGKE